MNTIKPTLPGAPVFPPPVLSPTRTSTPTPAAPAEPAAPVEIDLGSLLADQKQIDPARRSGAGFDVKTLNFEQIATRTMEKVAQVRRMGSDSPVLLRIGTSKVDISTASLNKEALVRVLSETLAKLSPADLQAAMQLAQSAKPLVDLARGKADPPQPVPPANEPAAPETLDDLFKSEFADAETFNKYAKGLLEGKLGVKSIDAGFLASYLHDALKGDSFSKRVRGLGFVCVRLHELSQRDPKVKDSLNRLIAQVEGQVPPSLQPVFKKLFTQKGPSLGHINNLYIVTQGKHSNFQEVAQNVYAAFELAHHFGPDIKAFLPPHAQRQVERLEALCGKQMGNAVGKLFRKFMPMGMASDFSIALCKIVASDNPVARMAGVVDLVKLTGLRLFGDSGQFASLMSFAKIDIETTVYAKQLLDPSSPGELKAKALKNIVEIYQTRIDKFVAAFPPGTIPASVTADAEKLLALIPKDPVEIAEKLAHYGLDSPNSLTAALGKVEHFGIENQEQLLSFLQKMGETNPQGPLQAVYGFGERGIKNVQQLTEVMGKLGVTDLNSLQKALKAFDSFGVKQIDDALGLIDKLGAKNAEQAVEALGALGIKPGRLSLEAMQQSVEKALTELAPHGVTNAAELVDLIKRTGAKNLDDVLARLQKTGISTGEEGVEWLAKLGVKNSAQVTELLTVLGVKSSSEAAAIVEKFAAFGLKGEDLMKLMDTLGLSGAREADKALALLGKLGVQATDNAEKTLAGIKSLGVRYIDRFAKDLAKLEPFGIKTLEDAADAAKLLGIKNFDEFSEGFARLAKRGVPSLAHADTLFRNLAVSNLDEALLALDKLSRIGARTPDQAIDLMRTLAQTKITTVDQALDLFNRLGVKNFDDLGKFMPELEKLAGIGIDSGPQLIEFVTTMGARNLKQAVASLIALEELGFKGAKAIELAQKLGLEKTGRLAGLMEKLGMRANKVEVLAAKLQHIGVKSMADALELLEKTGLKNADDLVDLFRKFNIYDDKSRKAVMEALGCGDDLARLGATLSKMKDLAIDHLDDAISFARKLGVESVAEAADLMGRFGKAGIEHPDEVLKLLEKLGFDVAGKSPAEMVVQMERALALTEEAAKYGVKGLDDIAETITRTGSKTAAELGEKMAARAGKANVLSKAIGLSDEAGGALIKLVQNGHMSEEVLEKTLNVLKALGREKADTVARLLVHMQPDILAAVFKNEALAKTLLSGVAEMAPKLTKLGISAAAIGTKLGKGILKALPALGIAMSAADAVRTRKIAMTGQWTEIGLKGFGKTITYNADARGLAAIAGSLNTVDTMLAVAEWALPGMGPILTAAPQIGLALTEVALDVMMDHYNEHPMPAEMKNYVEVAAYATCAVTLDFASIAALNESYGQDAERMGDVLAKAITQSKKSPKEIEHFISELSKSWTRNDNATRALFDQLDKQGVSLASLMKRQPPPLTQHALELLFDNLDSSLSSDDGIDYARMTTIAQEANEKLRGHIITRLMNQHTNDKEEHLIHGIIHRASNAELRDILTFVNVSKLAGELENPRHFKEALDRIVGLGDAHLLDAFIASKDIKQDQAVTLTRELLAAGVPLTDRQRAVLFDRLSEGGDAKLLQQLLMGNQASGGKLAPVQDKALISKMIGQAAERIGEFIDMFGNDEKQAAALAVMVLLHGNRSQIETAMAQINDNQTLGNGSEIVRTAVDQAKRQGIDLSGKLSHNALKSIMGSLNSGWTLALRPLGSEHKQAETLILDLARMADAAGKAAIIQDMMSGWTPTTYESKIQTIIRETKDPKEFTALIDRLDLAQLSKELENRKELGVVMATILERYQGDKDKALNTIMSAWSNASVQSDDILHHMLKTLESDKKLDALRQLPKSTLDAMIDWTDDAFRDGNALSLDAESHWTINLLQAAGGG